MTIIEQLEDADKTLAADGYKEYSYVRIAISEAIRALRQQPAVCSANRCMACEVEIKKDEGILLCGQCGR